MKKILAVLIFFLSALCWAAPAVSVDSSLQLSETPLPFGKPAELVITLSWDGSKPFEPPAADTLKVPDATMIDSYLVSGGGAGKKQATYHLLFTRFEPGDFTVGPVSIDSQAGPLTSKALKMTFAGSQPKKGDKKGEIRAIKPVVKLSTADFWKRLLIWLAGLTAVLLLVWYVVFRTPLFDRFRSPKSRALRALKRVLKSAPNPEAVLLRSTEVLREYLHRAYGLPAPTSTSSELVKGITLDNRCRDWKELTSEVLDRADRVKFAKGGVAQSEAADLAAKIVSQLKADKGGKAK